MKFDNVIIGAGLAGMTAALRLAEAGRKVAVISAGRSATFFNSGSFGLMGFDGNHNPVDNPFDALTSLPDDHPYSKIGCADVAVLASKSKEILARASVKVSGTHEANHKRVSPLGIMRPAWLTLDGVLISSAIDEIRSEKVAIVTLAGFLDFYPRFIAASLANEGITCEILTVDTPQLRMLRTSETEMRSANIARVLHGDAVDDLAAQVNRELEKVSAGAVIFPAVIDFCDEAMRFRSLLKKPMFYAPTVGVSVPGISIHTCLVRRFLSLGGVMFNGHRVTNADFDNSSLKAVYTDKLDEDAIAASDFIFAAGSFFSHGLLALPDAVIEPALGLDVVPVLDRDRRADSDMFAAQPFNRVGIDTDNSFKARRDGSVVDNLYVVGSALAGADSLREDAGAGIAMVSALFVAENILNN